MSRMPENAPEISAYAGGSKSKRAFDLIFSITGLLVLFPLLVLISIALVMFSGFPVFFLQKRVGRHGKDIQVIKFRTMKKAAENKGLLTVGNSDPRITTIGYFLRKYKLDELPQLVNVLAGNMSLVGPRPEVRKYVNRYTEAQNKVLLVKPGITDYASLAFYAESEMLAQSADPENAYVKEIMPAKLMLNLTYIKEAGLMTDIKIIIKTVAKPFHPTAGK